MSDETGIGNRLAQAIAHLRQEGQERIASAAREAGIETGFKGQLARLAGMGSPSTLSDILAGRNLGQRYIESLADLLGVDPGWLRHGSDRAAPDWALGPVEAYERWLRRLRVAFTAWCGDLAGDASAALGLPLKSDSRFADGRLGPEERARVAEGLALEADDPHLELVLDGRWHELPFALLVGIADELAVPRPGDPERVRQGHAAAAAVVEARSRVVDRLRDQFTRLVLPTELFDTCRLALVTLLQQRRWQGLDETAVADALELLWRQQLLARDEALGEPPAGFLRDTGRDRWTGVAEIQARYGPVDANPAGEH